MAGAFVFTTAGRFQVAESAPEVYRLCNEVGPDQWVRFKRADSFQVGPAVTPLVVKAGAVVAVEAKVEVA